VLTSNAGWDTIKHEGYLHGVIAELKEAGIRTSIFVDPIAEYVEGAAKVGTDRIELYTEQYARVHLTDPKAAIAPYVEAAKVATGLGLELNAGHDLDLTNLEYFKNGLDELLEVSIGHALVCDALYLGLENTIQMYLRQLND
jgi:pyridoxine 5-phosphate synthase